MKAEEAARERAIKLLEEAELDEVASILHRRSGRVRHLRCAAALRTGG